MKIEKYVYPDPFATSIAATMIGINKDPSGQKHISKMIESKAHKVSLGEKTELVGRVYNKNGVIKNIYM